MSKGSINKTENKTRLSGEEEEQLAWELALQIN